MISIFNSYKYYTIHENESTSYLDIKNGQLKSIGAFSYTIKQKQLISPIKGTYGGIELNSKNLFEISKKVKEIEESIKNENIKESIITTPPLYLKENIKLINQVLLEIGYLIIDQVDHFIIKLNNIPFSKKINRGNLKRLKKSEKNEFNFKKINLNQAFDLIKKNRSEKEYNLSMNFQDILKMKDVFHEKIESFGVIFENKLIASAICYRIDRNIAYVMFWGNLRNYNQFSPIVFLCNNIYNYYSNLNYSYLDIGSAMTPEGINIGLKVFKQRLGFIPSTKYTLMKKYE